MQNIIKIPYIIVRTITGLFILFLIVGFLSCNEIKSSLEAKELTGTELENFLNTTVAYDPISRNTVKEIFYSGNLKNGMVISKPKKKGSRDSNIFYAIIINQEGVSPNKSSIDISLTKRADGLRLENVSKRTDGTVEVSYNGIKEINPFLLDLFPTGYFVQVPQNLELYEQKRAEEYEKTHTPEGWPIDSIYTSHLFLREGIDDTGGRVGDFFYSKENNDLMEVKAPTRNGDEYMILISGKDKGNMTAIRIYLKYNSTKKTSFLDRIAVTNEGDTKTFTTFEDKRAGLLMIGSTLRQK